MTVIYNSECTNRWSSVSGAAINDQHICIFEEPNTNPTKMGMNFGTPEGKQFLLHKWHPVPYLKLYI
jgi:hypothetical protein